MLGGLRRSLASSVSVAHSHPTATTGHHAAAAAHHEEDEGDDRNRREQRVPVHTGTS